MDGGKQKNIHNENDSFPSHLPQAQLHSFPPNSFTLHPSSGEAVSLCISFLLTLFICSRQDSPKAEVLQDEPIHQCGCLLHHGAPPVPPTLDFPAVSLFVLSSSLSLVFYAKHSFLTVFSEMSHAQLRGLWLQISLPTLGTCTQHKMLLWVFFVWLVGFGVFVGFLFPFSYSKCMYWALKTLTLIASANTVNWTAQFATELLASLFPFIISLLFLCPDACSCFYAQLMPCIILRSD